MDSMASSSTSPSEVNAGYALGSLNINSTPLKQACVFCQHRKVKCDRNPRGCANCAKAGTKCVPSTRAPTRRRRRPNQDLQQRLAHCEQLLQEYASAEIPEQSLLPDHGIQTASSSSVQDEQIQNHPLLSQQSLTPERDKPVRDPIFDGYYIKAAPAGKLVHEDGGVRFMDSFLLGTISDELKAMRSMLDDDSSTPEADEASPFDGLAPDDNEDLLMGGDPQISLEDLHPEPGQVFRLWQIYLERVDPLTKIIHVPTVQPFLADAASGTLHEHVKPLVFGIYTLATISLTPDECKGILGTSRDSALKRFSAGVKIALIRRGFLQNTDMITLQALLMYLLSFHGRSNLHAAWVLSGTVIRVAQKMGMHRDGEKLGLSPFETEMRRRIWWQLIGADARYAMFSGLSYSLLPRNCDTKEPKNINDTDLHPSATQPIQDKDGPTEMIFCMLANKLVKMKLQSSIIEPTLVLTQMMTARDQPGPEADQYQEFRRIIKQTADELDIVLNKFCDPSVGPLHELAIIFKKAMVRKLDDLIARKKSAGFGDGQATTADNAFVIAVWTLEEVVERYEKGINARFVWFLRLPFQLDVFAYVCGQLCYRLSGTYVDRAWKMIEQIYGYHHELMDMSQKTCSAVATFVLKAWRVREETIMQQTGRVLETPKFIHELSMLKPLADIKITPPSWGQDPLGADSTNDTEAMHTAFDNMPSMEPSFEQQFLFQYLNNASLDWQS